MNTLFTMKLQKITSISDFKKRMSQNWSIPLLSLTVLFAFILFSFRPDTHVDLVEKNISFSLNGQFWESVKITDATIIRSEQTKSIFAKTLNINGVDANGASVVITVFDVQAADIGQSLSKGDYYGLEHEEVNRNFTFDIGIASFSNKCNLIYEAPDEKVISSRNGKVTIQKCENGKISGNFEFKTDSGEIFSKGKFKDVIYKFSE